MAERKVEIRPKADDGTYPDIIYPKTTADMVVDEDTGQTVAEHLADDTIHKTSNEIRTEETTPLRTEVVSSFPSSRPDGSIIFHSGEGKFFGRVNGEWV